MKFSFVFAKGRMAVNGGVVEADVRLHHLDLPWSTGLCDPVSGTVAGEEVVIPAVDVLGALRALSDGGVWATSGARAHLVSTAAIAYPEGAYFLDRFDQMVADGALLDGPGRVEERSGRRSNPWVAYAPSQHTGKEVTKSFSDRRDAEAWLQRRTFADRAGWAYKRLDAIVDGEVRALTLDEMLDIADALGEPPSLTLQAAKAELTA